MQPFSSMFERGLLRLQAAELAQLTLRPYKRRGFQTLQMPRNQPWQRSKRPQRQTVGQQQAARTRPMRQQQRYQSSKKPSEDPSPNPTPHLGSPAAAPSLSQRLKNMSREYGWTALGVYLALSALDFPFCFLAVRMLGVDRIGRWEHAIVRGFWDAISIPFPGGEEQVRAAFRNVGSMIKSGLQAVGLREADIPKPSSAEGALGGANSVLVKDGAVTGPGDWTWGVEEAQEEASKEGATLATQLALAYAVHKSFIFVRVPLTAAILPRVVKTLRGWGWNIGKKTPKISKA